MLCLFFFLTIIIYIFASMTFFMTRGRKTFFQVSNTESIYLTFQISVFSKNLTFFPSRSLDKSINLL